MTGEQAAAVADDVAAARLYVAERMAYILAGPDLTAHPRALGLIFGYRGDHPDVIAAVVAEVDDHLSRAGR